MKIIVVSFLFFFLNHNCFSQLGSQIVIDSIANGITEIISLDINNDSLADIAISQKFSHNNKISYYINLGNGQFGSQQTVASNINWPTTLAAGDLNNDGWSDLVSASADHHLFWISNNLGTFDPLQIIDSNLGNFGSNHVVKIEDVNNDSHLDIVATGELELSVYINDGNAVFTKQIVPAGINTEYYTLDIADLNGDGFKDIIAGGVHTLIYMNNGATFTYDTIRSLSVNSNDLVFLVRSKNFDNDNNIDLVVNGSNNSIMYFSNDGNGFFTLSEIIDNITNCESITSSDFDLDGDLDLFAPNNQLGTLIWYQNNGTGSFGSGNLVHQTNIPFPTRVHSADLNNDGRNEAIWSYPLSFHLNSFPIIISESQNSNFLIYPNPASNKLYIKSEQFGKISIYNNLGQLIMKDIDVKPQEMIIDLYLTSGIYTLTFKTDKNIISKKILIE